MLNILLIWGISYLILAYIWSTTEKTKLHKALYLNQDNFMYFVLFALLLPLIAAIALIDFIVTKIRK